jgi:hypothetical protein
MPVNGVMLPQRRALPMELQRSILPAAFAVDQFGVSKGSTVLQDVQAQQYTTKIIKTSALVRDTRLLLASWDCTSPIEQNLKRARQENPFGKASRSRVEDILAIFRQRYMGDPDSLRALVILAQSSLAPEAFDRILYYYAATADSLLRDVVIDVLWAMFDEGRREFHIANLERIIRGWVAEGKTTTAWGDYTIRRVVQGLAATLRDFGILEGAVNKRVASPYLPVEAFAYVAFMLGRQEPSGQRILAHPAWRLYLLALESVERLFMEAHQRHLLHYQAAGPIIRIEFPARSIEEYARVIAETTP